LIRASELHETEANLHLAQIYDNGVDGSMFVIDKFRIKTVDFSLFLHV